MAAADIAAVAAAPSVPSKPRGKKAEVTFGNVQQPHRVAAVLQPHPPLAVVTIFRKSHFSNLYKRRIGGVLNRFEKWAIRQVGQTSARFDIKAVKV